MKDYSQVARERYATARARFLAKWGWLPILGLSGAVFSATDRVDYYDARGQRTGYAIVDRETGRVDYYNSGSRRIGYGKVDGRAETFDLQGERQAPALVPVTPKR